MNGQRRGHEHRYPRQRFVAPQNFEQLPAGQARHSEVQNESTNGASVTRVKHVESVPAVPGLEYGVALVLENGAHAGAHVVVVVHDENGPATIWRLGPHTKKMRPIS